MFLEIVRKREDSRLKTRLHLKFTFRTVLHVQSSYGFLNLRSIGKITGLAYGS